MPSPLRYLLMPRSTIFNLRLLAVLVLTVGWAILFRVPSAQAADANTVSLVPVWTAVGGALTSIVQALIGLLVTVATAWLARQFHLTNLKIDDNVRDYLDKIAVSAIQYGVNKASASPLGSVEAKNAILKIAYQYMVSAAPDGLKKFCLTEEGKLMAYLEARLTSMHLIDATTPLPELKVMYHGVTNVHVEEGKS